jgi:hypothetical protein
MKHGPFVALLKDGNWDAVRERVHSQAHEDICGNSKAISGLITLKSAPFDVYVQLTRICERSRDIFEPFSDEFILEHADNFISISGPSLFIQKIFKRNSSSLDKAAFDVMEKQSPHLLYEWWTIRKCLELSRGETDRQGLSYTLFQKGIRRKIGNLVEHLQEDTGHRQTVIDSLACYTHLYYHHLSNFREEDSRLCFVEFFGVLRKDFRQMLMFKDIVMGLKLMHCALDYGEDGIFQELVRLLQKSSLENSGKSSILHDVALLKRPLAISKALGIGAPPEDLHLYPYNRDVLFQTDERNLSPLNYLWIVEQPPCKRIDRVFAKRWEREPSLQKSRVEGALKCLHSFEQKFPGISRHFVYAWTGAVVAIRNLPCQDLSLFTLDMMKRVMNKIAKDEGRKPLHVACDYGISWNAGLRVLYHERGSCVDALDPKTNLKPFALAASGNESELSSVYELLRLSPTAILHY